MGINKNTVKKLFVNATVVNEKGEHAKKVKKAKKAEKNVVLADTVIVHDGNMVQNSKIAAAEGYDRKNSMNPTQKNVSVVENYDRKMSRNSTQKKSSVYSIYKGFPVESQFRKESARQSIVSIRSEKQKLDHEKWYQILLQVSVPFFIAGIGTIGAGIVLAEVTKLQVFNDVASLFILIPALLGLKGNLDMCLASRLSTQANLGKFEDKKELMKIIVGNVLLVQIQAIVASCVVSVFAVTVSALVNGNFEWIHTLLLATASTLTATMSCFTLDLVLVSVIVLSHKFKLNPDNIATPMAASIGDVVSLLTLSVWAMFLYDIHDDYAWVLGIIVGFYIVVLLPIWIFIVRQNEYTKDVLTHGWVPVITALFISGSGGIVLDTAVDRFKGYAVFQPIINGIGGNLVSVQASRISTMLHKTSFQGVIPLHTKQWASPFEALIRGVLPAKSARILIGLCIPGHIFFVLGADVIYSGGFVTINPFFLTMYLLVAFIQIVVLLYLCHIMVHTMWTFRMDPDNSAIPYLTAIGDLLGSTLLIGGFFFLNWIGHEYRKSAPKRPINWNATTIRYS